MRMMNKTMIATIVITILLTSGIVVAGLIEGEIEILPKKAVYDSIPEATPKIYAESIPRFEVFSELSLQELQAKKMIEIEVIDVGGGLINGE